MDVDENKVAQYRAHLDAKDEDAVAFYRHYEFVPLKDQTARMFLPVGIIEKLSA